ncbi:MAG: OmpA family protein [Flavobacteriaceae bacterium]|nr:OmpA family protein [Flavobacteriaceae bacterium]
MKKILLFILCIAVQITFAQNKERYTIKNINANNKYSNFGTSYFGTNKIVFASPKKRSFVIQNNWKPNGQPFLDLFVGDIAANGEIENVKKLSKTINTKWHEADVIFTKDGNTVYFTRSNFFKGKYGKDKNGENNLKLFKARVGTNGKWKDITSVHFNNDEYSVGHPALSSDGRTLYFISDMPGTLGKTDIFKVAVLSDGTLGTPMNLGDKINTIGREMFPFVGANDVLYFASDSLAGGLGGLDIYSYDLITKTAPENLGAPLNSPKDDFAYIYNEKKKSGYFSSNRPGGKGDDDIYYFTDNKEIIKKCEQVVSGIVLDRDTREKLPYALVELFEKGTSIKEIKTTGNATFTFIVDCSNSYKVVGAKEEYQSNNIVFETSDKPKEKLHLDLELEKTDAKKDDFVVTPERTIININPIYFDFDEWNIRPDAARELNKVVAVMKQYPQLKIEGASHTDSRGRESYNLELSQKRAASTVKYIVSKGISPERMYAKGYGESQLTNQCTDNVRCKRSEHQLNRRTEFIVLNPEFINK